MGIRKPADWMQPADDRILEYLESHQAAGPKLISEDDEVSLARSTIANRIRVLHAGGLVNRIQRGTYTLSDKGSRYLAGVEDLRDDRDEPEPE